MSNIYNRVPNVPCYMVGDLTDPNKVFNDNVMSTVKWKMGNNTYPNEVELVEKLHKMFVEIIGSTELIVKVSKDWEPGKYIVASNTKCVLEERSADAIFKGKNLTRANILVREGFKSYVYKIGNYVCGVLRGVIAERTYVWCPSKNTMNPADHKVCREAMYHGSLHVKEFKGSRGATYVLRLRRQIS